MIFRQQIATSAFIIAAAFGTFACSSSGGTPEETEDPGGTTKDPYATAPCEIDSGYPGDEICIGAPPADKGFQLHWGPKDYDDTDEVAEYLLDPGAETNIFVNAVSGNEMDVYFYKRQYRMRQGSHHLIVSDLGTSSGIPGMGRRLGGSQNPIKDNPTGDTPPENEGVGMPLSAHAELNLNLHHYNGTEETILREAWVNFWYVDPDTVTKEANEMFLMATHGNIPANAHVTVTGERTVNADGRILTTYGHRHSNNVRFTAYRHRGDEKLLIYEDFDWEEPAVLEYNSLTANPAPNKEAGAEGGYSGILDVKAGDKLSWECEIQNKSGEEIIFNQNEAITSEMCILVGDTIDVKVSPF